jgi:hypothetical protein
VAATRVVLSQPMRNPLLSLCGVAACVALSIGCGDSTSNADASSPNDAPADVQVDRAPVDVAVDVANDVAIDAPTDAVAADVARDVTTDQGADVATDTQVDASRDAADGAVDAALDAAGDVGSDVAADVATDAAGNCGTATCAASEVCVRTVRTGGACRLLEDGGTCPEGTRLAGSCCVFYSETFSCAPRPSGCSPTLACGCASALCTGGCGCQGATGSRLECACFLP